MVDYTQGDVKFMANIYTIPEAARVLKISERTLYSWLRDNVIPGRKLRGCWRISEAALEQFLLADNSPKAPK